MKTLPLSLSACFVLLSSLAPLHAVPQGGVTWYRFDSFCSIGNGDFTLPSTPNVQPEVVEVSCGAYGRLFFGRPGLSYQGLQCDPLGTGSATPAVYPEETAPAGPGLPCADGSCLGRKGGIPWVAVVDWDAPHGWTVAETVLSASDRQVEVELFDLADRTQIPSWLADVGDVHALARLCAVSEVAASGDAPLAVNLSFGRMQEAPNSPASGLTQEIEEVLAHLRGTHGTVVVAAAGHQEHLLFPASSGPALAAGSLDLAAWQDLGLTRPAPSTPAGTEVLVPGYGLYLDTEEGWWPLPAGSSYASALTTGWIAGTLASGSNQGSEIPETGSWVPVRENDRFVLESKEGTPAGSDLEQPTALLERALGIRTEACSAASTSGSSLLAALEGFAPDLPEQTLPEVVAATHGPQPGADPCVPCHGTERPFAGGDTKETAFVIDLSASGTLPAGHHLEGLYLQVGEAARELDVSSNPLFLGLLTTGTMDALSIHGLAEALEPGETLALLWVVRIGDDGPRYREITPVHVHQH